MADGRAKDGRAKHGGKRPGAGRKPKTEEISLAALLNECFTLEERKKLIKGLVKTALRFPMIDMDAAKLLLAYTFGKPKETVQHQGEFTAKFVRLPQKQTQEEWEQSQSDNKSE